MVTSIMPGDQPGFRIDPVDFPDPSNSPWLNPPATNANVLDPFGGTGGTAVPGTPGVPVGRNLPAPPPLPPNPAPAPTPTPGFSGRVSGNDGQTPIYRPNEIEGGGNTKESAAYVEKKNADAAKIAKTEARVEAHHAKERAKVARERQRTAEKSQRWHAEETADARKAQIAQQQKLAKALTTKVKQLMEPAGHARLSDDAKVVQAARRAPLTAEAAASNDRQAKALGNIGGVGDLPVYTADAAENYGDTGINEVADLIHRTAATDPAKAKALLDRTTARMSDAKAAQLKQTVASYTLDDEPELAGQYGSDNLQGGAGEDELRQSDYYELPEREKSRIRFPDRQSPEGISNLERIKRMAGSKRSVVQDIPPYKTPMQRPKEPQQEKRAIVHILKLKPEMNERLRESDLETLRLFQRFRQLDKKDTARLNEGLAEIGKRDKNLLYALVQKKYNAEHYPEEETWAMSDAELDNYHGKLSNANPTAERISNEVKQTLESLKRPYIGGIFAKQAETSGARLTPHEQRIKDVANGDQSAQRLERTALV